jgi:hypothetical protein
MLKSLTTLAQQSGCHGRYTFGVCEKPKAIGSGCQNRNWSADQVRQSGLKLCSAWSNLWLVGNHLDRNINRLKTCSCYQFKSALDEHSSRGSGVLGSVNTKV